MKHENASNLIFLLDFSLFLTFLVILISRNNNNLEILFEGIIKIGSPTLGRRKIIDPQQFITTKTCQKIPFSVQNDHLVLSFCSKSLNIMLFSKCNTFSEISWWQYYDQGLHRGTKFGEIYKFTRIKGVKSLTQREQHRKST